MASSTTSGVYIHVIEDVINKVRDEFVGNGGPGDGVLKELQGLWELKMMQAGAILGPIDRTTQKAGVDGVTPNAVHDLNVPYEGTEEYETPTADMLFPPTPLQTPMQTPLPGAGQTPLPGMSQTPLPGTAPTPLSGLDSGSLYSIPTGGTPITPNEYTSNNENGGVPEINAGHGRPSPYMPPSAWSNQRPPLDVNVAYVEGREENQKGGPHQPTTQDFFMPSGKRKRDDFPPPYHTGGYIPQQDGAGDNLSDAAEVVKGDSHQMSIQGGVLPSMNRIPQLDGQVPDPYDDMLSTPNIYNYQGVVNEDYNAVNTPAPHEMQAATPAPVQNDPADDDEDEPLNEDDDDDELDDVDEGDDENTMHLVVAQFEKVTRTKSRWKCTLKNGIMHINNKDFMFSKATGEFDF
ncbi:transcription initiation factor IIA large subunit-like isoform X2 [Andrographis paniculata]|uniref:transcription initiation factor IIA large subunit-like isoform X2 n=1 Tax=Andrographis paniculata TaxID=175694 RepID=UPI0021E7C698|nr:transcription initiation factor IIA large subunit-like isoform X2 [Andrographis paniculata]